MTTASQLSRIFRRALLVVAVCLGALASRAAESPRLGFPPITVYRQELYKASGQNFDIAQAPNGTLYFANGRGILTYDGAWWSVIDLPRESPGLAIDIDRTGRIAVGAIGDFGLLDPQPDGTMKFRSLLQLLPAKFRENLGDVDGVVAWNGFIFSSEAFVVHWDGKALHVLDDGTAKPEYRRAQIEDGKPTILRRSGGIQAVGGPMQFAGKRIDAVAGDLVVIRKEGLFSRATEQPLDSAASRWLKDKIVMGSSVLRDGRVALATLRDGVLVTFPDGRIDQVIGTEAGLPEGLVNGAFLDRDESLWLACDSGIARLDLDSSLAVLDSRVGLLGGVHDVQTFQSRVYAGTTHGLYYFDAATGDASTHAQQVDSIRTSVWSLLPVGNELLVGALDGIYVMSADGRTTKVAGTTNIVYSMAAQTPTRVYLGFPDTQGWMSRTADGWKYEGELKDGVQLVRSMLVENGSVWCASMFDGVVRIAPDGSTTRFGTGGFGVYDLGGRRVFIHDSKFVQLDANGRFVPDPLLGAAKNLPRFDSAAVDRNGNIWISSTPPLAIRKTASGYETDSRSALETVVGEIESMGNDRTGALLIGTDRGLFRVAPSTRAAAAQPAPMIHRVVTGADKTLFAGSGGAPHIDLPHDFRRLHIEFAPGVYRGGVTYEYRLDPADERWNQLSDTAFVDFTNLDENDYTFRIRARGATGTTSAETQWKFAVSPPWYRTRLATIVWLLLAAGLVALVVVLRTRALRLQAEELRVRVANQTVALRESVDQLRTTQRALVEKNEELAGMNQQLAEANVRLEQLAIVDDLTGIANRREFQRALEEEWTRGTRSGQPLALILVDLDYFKTLNDELGHPMGDECLQRIGRYLAEAIRGGGDLATRFGGEEFALLLPATGADEARAVAERIRVGIERMAIPSGAALPPIITASFGIASVVPAREIAPQALIERADRALYAAKHAGRNCVRVDDESATGTWLHATA